MKYAINYIIFFISISCLYSTDVRIVETYITEFPERIAEFYFLDDNSKPIININNSLLEFEINGKKFENYNLIRPDKISYNPVSIVVSIDNSLQNEKNYELIKRTINRLARNILNNELDIAIQTYNSSSFIIQNFTSDFQKIERAINNLSFRNTSNYNTAFLNSQTGSIEIAKNSQYKSLILNITSGKSIGDSNSISNIANMNGIPVYNYVFEDFISNNLFSISSKTGGKYFRVNDEEMFYSHLLYAILKEAGTVPFRLNFINSSCEREELLSLKYNVLIIDKYNATYQDSKFPFIEVFPNPIDFGVVNIGQEDSLFLTVRARNANILLEDILFDNSQYDIIPKTYKGKVLQNNSPNIFTLKFKSKSTNYNYSKIEFISDICNNTSIDIFNGRKEGDKQDTDLEVIRPNGNEIYYPGKTIDLLWDGVLNTQEVLIEYSSNNGVLWEVITENGINKNYKWTVPEINSEEMLLRVSIPSGSVKYDKVKYVSDNSTSKKIKKSIVSYDNRYAALSFKDGSLFTWDLESGVIKTQLRDINQGINTSDIEFGVNTSLIAAAFGKNNEYDVVVWDADNPSNTNSKSFNSKVNDLEWSDDGTTIFIALNNGNLVKWDLASDELTTITTFSSSVNNISINHNKEIIGISTDNSFIISSFEGLRMDSITINGIYDLEWNQNGTRIFVVYDFRDLRFYSITGQGNNFKLKQEQRIVRNESSNIVNSEWVTSNSVLIQSKNSSVLEYWSIDNIKLEDINIHKEPVSTLNANGKTIISSLDTNTALVWNIDEYPFDFRTLDSDISDKTWTIKNKDIRKKDIALGSLCLNESYYFEFDDNFINKNIPVIIIDSILCTSDDIRLKNTFPIELTIDSSLKLNFYYSPITSGNKEFYFLVYHGNNIDSIKVSSSINSSSISIIDNKFNFINTLVNSSKSIRKNILQNNSGKDIKFSNAEFIIGNEVFSIIDDNLNNVSDKNDLFLEIKFEPKSSGLYSGLLELTSIDLCSTILIEIIGNAVNTNIIYYNQIDLGLASCNTIIDSVFYIYNYSLDSITLESKNIMNNSSFGVNVDLPRVIKSNDSLMIEAKFIDNGIGIFESSLEFTTDLAGNDKTLIVDLIAIRDTLSIIPLKNELDFGTIKTKNISTKTIRFFNNSKIPFEFQFPSQLGKFELLEANPKFIEEGDTSTVVFRFEGNDRDTVINYNFNLGKGCSSDLLLPLLVTVSDGTPLLGYESLINLDTINCKNESVYKITLHNVGTNNLIIDSLFFIGNNSNSFTIKDIKNEYNVLPNDSLIIEFIYIPNEYGEISSNLIILSNAQNSTSNSNSIRIELFQKRTELELNLNKVEFEGLRSNKKYSRVITVTNIGNTNININFFNDVFFVVDSIKPSVLKPEETASIYISFLGGLINTQYSGEIKIFDDCNREYIITALADVGGNDYVSIKPTSIKARTGEEVDLNILFENTTSIELPINDTISTKLVLNASILAPKNKKYDGIIINGERIIELKIPLIENNVIYKIPMIVTLGDTSYSKIKLIESSHLENGFFIEDFESGSITVTNIDTLPTDRYIDSRGRAYLSETYPSPVEGFAVIKYGVIENTNVTISIFDILGNRVEVLVDKYHIAGEYTIEINPQNLSSGNYLYILETPSMEIIKKMTIIR